jgi:hypothetical protein
MGVVLTSGTGGVIWLAITGGFSASAVSVAGAGVTGFSGGFACVGWLSWGGGVSARRARAGAIGSVACGGIQYPPLVEQEEITNAISIVVTILWVNLVISNNTI